MGKTIRHNQHSETQHESAQAKTRPLGNNKRMDPLNQGGMHVADTHVRGKRLQRTWPKTNEKNSGHHKV